MMRNNERTFWIILSSFLVVGLVLSYGPRPVRAQFASNQAMSALSLFQNVFVKVLNEYVDEQKPEDLLHNAIDGMIKGLGDPHSALLRPKNFTDLKTETAGQYGGLGIQVGMRENKITVIAPMEDTPAEKVGLRPDDRIVRINGTNAIGLELDKAVEKLRGPVGDPVTISIEREGEKAPFDVTIVREVINVKSVRFTTLATNLGYVRLTSFSQNTPEQLALMLKNIAKSNYAGLVIDLRNNPGGLLDAALKISDMFLDGGTIVSTRGRTAFNSHVNTAEPGVLVPDSLPIVVLVNKGSASASEIFAGAMQDTGRGLLLGTQTFGKGSVQTVLNLDEGYGLRLTIARYYTPAGRMIDKIGLTPDIIVETPPLTREEVDMINRLDKTNIIRVFAAGFKDKEIKDEDFLRLKDELKKAGIEVRDAIVRSRLRFEQTRKYAAADVDLDLDNQLRQAVQILKTRRILDRPNTR
jgi:carboxyl-terminal processing protease